LASETSSLETASSSGESRANLISSMLSFRKLSGEACLGSADVASAAEMFWADIPSSVSHLERDREFADSPLEETVLSELVS
jgi:hypothetical protein